MICDRCIHKNVCKIEYDIHNCADYFELVRCKDCKYNKTGWCMNDYIRDMCCGDDATYFATDPDFFCKFGERKETNG